MELSWNRIAPAIAIGAVSLTACSPVGRSGPSWFLPESNVAYAASAICAPYVLDNADAAGLLMAQPLVRDDGWRANGDKLDGGHVRVGVAGSVHVAIGGVNGGGRACEISSGGADPQAMRHAVLAVLAQRPEAFAPTRSHYLPGRFEPRIFARRRKAGTPRRSP